MIPFAVLTRWPVLARSSSDGGPCPEAVAWLCSLPADTTPEQAIAACPRAGWLVWLFARSGPACSVPEHGGAILATLGYAEAALWESETEEQRTFHGVAANRQALADLRVAGVEFVDAEVVALLHRDDGVIGRVRAALWPEMGGA